MKITYCGAFRFPIYDAASQRVLNNGKAMRASGHEVNFISWGGKYREEDLGTDGKYYIDGFEYIITDELDKGDTISEKIKGLLNRGKKTLSLLNHIDMRPDVIILYNANFSWTCKMIKFCSVRNVKLVNDITEWYDNNELYLFQQIPNWLNMVYIQQHVRNKILISNYLKQQYPKSFNITIPPLCDSSEPKWNDLVEDTRIKPFDGITLIYAGNPARKDAVHYAINAVQKLIEEGAFLRFVILGVDRNNYIKNYRGLLANMDLSESIQFLGRVSQDKVPSYYAMADFMILMRKPNRKSNAGFPTKFSESFTSGTPVIANLTSDLGLYLKDGETGFVVEEPSESSIYRILKEKVLPLSRCEIEKMKQNVKAVSSQFDYHAYVEPLREFMNNLK